MYLPILHLQRVELRCKSQGKLHSVSEPLVPQVYTLYMKLLQVKINFLYNSRTYLDLRLGLKKRHRTGRNFQ